MFALSKPSFPILLLPIRHHRQPYYRSTNSVHFPYPYFPHPYPPASPLLPSQNLPHRLTHHPCHRPSHDHKLPYNQPAYPCHGYISEYVNIIYTKYNDFIIYL
ncbi:hypothetical protein RND81_14G243800 [Saponaria officinalis]|uniref:Uncharacterized protein n=1 Tax=Saponaria officinalis TaxID=3572 RepID=A0AAW1H1J0_SAPOF